MATKQDLEQIVREINLVERYNYSADQAGLTASVLGTFEDWLTNSIPFSSKTLETLRIIRLCTLSPLLFGRPVPFSPPPSEDLMLHLLQEDGQRKARVPTQIFGGTYLSSDEMTIVDIWMLASQEVFKLIFLCKMRPEMTFELIARSIYHWPDPTPGASTAQLYASMALDFITCAKPYVGKLFSSANPAQLLSAAVNGFHHFAIFIKRLARYDASSISNEAAAFLENCQHIGEEAAQFHDKGNNYFKETKYDNAVSQYTKAIQRCPFSSKLYGNRAQANLRLKKPKLALSDALRAFVLDPENAKANWRYAQALYESGYLFRAIVINKIYQLTHMTADLKDFKEQRSIMECDRPAWTKEIVASRQDSVYLEQQLAASFATSIMQDLIPEVMKDVNLLIKVHTEIHDVIVEFPKNQPPTIRTVSAVEQAVAAAAGGRNSSSKTSSTSLADLAAGSNLGCEQRAAACRVQSKDGPAMSELVAGPSSDTAGLSSNGSRVPSKAGSAQTKNCSEPRKAGPAQSKDGPEPSKAGSEQSKDSPAQSKDGPEPSKAGSARSKDSPAQSNGGPAPSETDSGQSNSDRNRDKTSPVPSKKLSEEQEPSATARLAVLDMSSECSTRDASCSLARKYCERADRHDIGIQADDVGQGQASDFVATEQGRARNEAGEAPPKLHGRTAGKDQASADEEQAAAAAAAGATQVLQETIKRLSIELEAKRKECDDWAMEVSDQKSVISLLRESVSRLNAELEREREGRQTAELATLDQTKAVHVLTGQLSSQATAVRRLEQQAAEVTLAEERALKLQEEVRSVRATLRDTLLSEAALRNEISDYKQRSALELSALESQSQEHCMRARQAEAKVVEEQLKNAIVRMQGVMKHCQERCCDESTPPAISSTLEAYVDRLVDCMHKTKAEFELRIRLVLERGKLLSSLPPVDCSLPKASQREALVLAATLPMPGVLGQRFLPSLRAYVNSTHSLQSEDDAVLLAGLLSSFSVEVSEDAHDPCVICYEDMDEKEAITELTCKHVYHTKCIGSWLNKPHATCPMCRRQVVPTGGTGRPIM